MAEIENGFVSRSFLRSVWADEYAAFQESPAEADLLARLQRWAALDAEQKRKGSTRSPVR